MSQNTNIVIEHEKKERIPAWLYPSTLKAIDKAMYRANCKSRSEFLENAAQMYAGYISADSAVEYLPAALVSALRATGSGKRNPHLPPAVRAHRRTEHDDARAGRWTGN